MTLSLIGTPVTTARQWTTALAPRIGGGYNFITQSYNYPSDTPTEWIVVHLEDGDYDIYLGPNGVYSNTNFQYPSVGTAITVNNQLRAPDGTIFFLGNIGPPTVYLAYYDPADEQVKFTTGNVAPANQSFCYSGIFNHDGTKLYTGTQCEGFAQPCVFEIDVASKAITLLGQGGSLTPEFPNYAYYLAKDEGPGADWIYFARGQSGWDLVAIQISTGIATTLFTTTGPGFQFIQLTGDATSCRAQIYDNGVPTNYYVFDGALSAVPPGVARDCTPYTNPLSHAPLIDWSNGIGQVSYQTLPFYDVLTPTSGEWISVIDIAGAGVVPSSIWQMQAASGNETDTGGGGRTLVAAGAGLTYESDVQYWPARRAIKFTENQSNKLTATIPNVNANSAVFLFYVQLYSAPGALVFAYELATAGAVEVTGAPTRYRADANTATDGTIDPGTTWHPLWLIYNLVTNAFQVITDQEVIEAGLFVGAGTAFTIAGTGGTNAAPMRTNYGAAWFGADAVWATAQTVGAINNALRWNNPLITPPWVRRDYTVANTAPIVLESLVSLPVSHQPLTNGVQYCGFATRLLWHGAWTGGPSQPKTLRIGDLEYLCGYPDGVLYSYTEAEDWQPDGAVTGNPSNLGAYSTGADQGMKYPYFLRYNASNDRIYCAGRRERDHDGSSLGWYSRSGAVFSIPENGAPLPEYIAPAGMVVLANLVVFSGNLFDDSAYAEAKITVYDLDLTGLNEWTVDAGMRNTGNIYPTGDPSIVMGIGLTSDARQLAYRINVLTGAVVQTRDISEFTVGPSDQTGPSTIYIVLDEELYLLNPDDLTTTALDLPIGFTPSYLAKTTGNRFYLTFGTQLYVLSGASDMNQFTPLPAPAGNGPGAAVDVSSYGPPKTVIVSGSWVLTGPTVTIEMSNDSAHAGEWAPVVTLQGAGVRQIVCAARFMRANVSNFLGGQAPVVNLGGNDGGCEFVTVVSPNGNGVGTAVDISALAELKTIWVGDDFTGALNVDISCDTGGLYWGTVATFSAAPGQKTILQAFAKWVRITRVGAISTNAPRVCIGGSPA